MTKVIVKMEGTVVNIDRGAAAECLKQVDDLASKLAATEGSLEHGYAKLGYLLFLVHRNEYWRAEHESFGNYILHVGEAYNRKRTQLYHYFSTVRELVPYVSEEQLNTMGISKAAALKKGLKTLGSFPPETINRACDQKVTVQDLRGILGFAANPQPEEGETWLDQEGFYVTVDERKVIEAADLAALRADPPVQSDVPSWVRRKEARLRQAMEFLAVHSGQEAT